MPFIEFWYDFASTYSYPAAMRFEERARAAQLEARWRPFLLGPVFAGLGWNTSPFNLQPAKGAYMWRDMERVCERLGLAFGRPDPFPQNSLLVARLAMTFDTDEEVAAFTRRVFEAEFRDGRSISEPETLNAVLDAMGEPTDRLERAQETQIKEALRSRTEDAVAAGIFGAPTFRTADGELFWGFDRLDEALGWARQHR
ncbi:MAG: 2-hydroxychromene-2-carboxylate isomerase [Pseudomonadota bacterium]